MEILAAANKPIKEWNSSELKGDLKSMVDTVELKGVSMDRKNIIYKNDLDESVQDVF